MALLEDAPRAATIVALKDCYMAVLDRKHFQQSLAKIETREKNKKIDFLKNLPIFKQWTKNQMYKMTYFFSEKSYGINHCVFKQDEPSDFIYIIKEGVFEATRLKLTRQGYEAEEDFR